MVCPKCYAEEFGMYPIGNGKPESGLKQWNAMNKFMLHKDHSGCMQMPDWGNSRPEAGSPVRTLLQ